MNDIIASLEQGRITQAILKEILLSDQYDTLLFEKADQIRQQHYGTDVYMRGLVEFSNHCKNNCFYCGIRRDNVKLERYRLSKEEILDCCENGYRLGFRTFVLQSGEDMVFDVEMICNIVSSIKSHHPDCAVTLSLGEYSKEAYQRFFQAGADRYLLRHETADEEHYAKLHPGNMRLENRKQCLFHLKEIGYQVGSGFMVGSPFQTVDHLISDIYFLKELQPDMIGIGPFISHSDTPFAGKENGTLALTLRLIAILRILFPYALIPATTALGTIDPKGRELGLKAGANVVMPNLSPVKVRKKYELYDNKICTGEEAAECRSCLEIRVQNAGYQLVIDRGDVIPCTGCSS